MAATPSSTPASMSGRAPKKPSSPGLEHQAHPERQVPPRRFLDQQPGGPQEAGGVGVVAAGVHAPRVAGGMGEPGPMRPRRTSAGPHSTCTS